MFQNPFFWLTSSTASVVTDHCEMYNDAKVYAPHYTMHYSEKKNAEGSEYRRIFITTENQSFKHLRNLP